MDQKWDDWNSTYKQGSREWVDNNKDPLLAVEDEGMVEGLGTREGKGKSMLI